MVDIKKTVYCDRCGKAIDLDKLRHNIVFRLFRARKYKVVIQNALANKYVDLCPECYISLVNWTNEKGHVAPAYWYDNYGNETCSNCGKGLADPQYFDGTPFKYCPNCGIKMEER